MPDFPALLQSLRERWRWFDHILRAANTYNSQKGDYYAAGITYFSILSLFPILMLSFAIAGFVLASRPDLLDDISSAITNAVPGSLGETVNSLVEAAINSRNTVGILGLLGALYTGLGWMSNIREALSAMWSTRSDAPNFVMTKIVDLGALVALGTAVLLSLGLSALSSGSVIRGLLGLVGLENLPGIEYAIRGTALALSLLATWALFTVIIARLPRETVKLRSAARAGLLAALIFEVFKQVAAFYLESVTSGPAGVVFGPIIGLMVFVNVTCRLLLFCTAWAATAKENVKVAPIEPPPPATLIPHAPAERRSGPVLAFAAGAVSAIGLSQLMRR